MPTKTPAARTTRAKAKRPAKTTTKKTRTRLVPAVPEAVWRKPVPAAKPQKITGPLTQRSLTEVVGADTGLPPETVQAVQRATWDAVARTLAAGHSVTITNFGTWSAYRRSTRKARNPQNGDRVLVAAHWAARWRTAPRLAQVVRGHKQTTASVKKLPKGTLTPPAAPSGEQP